MESSQNLPAEQEWPIPFQIFFSAFLLPFESFLAEHVTATVCQYFDFWGRKMMTTDDLTIFMVLLIPLAFISWLKHRAGLRWVVIFAADLLLILSICLDVWHVRGPLGW